MNLFVWKRAELVTWREHNEAGVVIIGLNLANARHLFKLWQQEHLCWRDNCDVYTADPDIAIPIAPRAHEVLVFPDAGCC